MFHDVYYELRKQGYERQRVGKYERGIKGALVKGGKRDQFEKFVFALFSPGKLVLNNALSFGPQT